MSHIIENELRTAVDKGAALLDDKVPGWHGRMRYREINMLDGFECILGQLFGSYLSGVRKLEIDPIEYGFNTRRAFCHGWLEELWQEKIREREAA